MRKCRFIQTIMACAIIAISCRAGLGQQFRIETEVFFGGEDEPIAENITLFSGGVVYDFMLTEPKEIAIFDLSRQQFTLLDASRKLKMALSREDILRFIASLKAKPDLQKKDPFFFDPRFDVSFDKKTNWLTLSSKRVTYRAKGVKSDSPAIARNYRAFADWYARLNATLPGKMPPFARLELNKALAAQQIIPERVEMTINPRRRLLQSKLQATSRHSIIWQLSNTDHERIDKANADSAKFKLVSFEKYRSIEKVASKRNN